MKIIHRRDESSLSPITPEDLEFAKNIVKEYDLPMSETSWLIRDVRDEIQLNVKDFRKLSKFRPLYKKCQDILFAPDVELQRLTITTNKGAIRIKSSDPFFDLFSFSIKKTRSNFRNSLYQEEHYITRWSKESPINKIVYYFRSTSLIPTQKVVAITKFLVHFRFFSNKQIITEQEFKNNTKLAAIDYYHYLYDRGESLLKKYLPEDQILFIDESGQN